jgi:hypothetical protein
VSISHKIIAYIKANPSLKKNEAPEDLCPNCWGREEYGGKFYEVLKNKNVDINTAHHELGWIQDYAVKHFEPIKLDSSNKDNIVCKQCKLIYKEAK